MFKNKVGKAVAGVAGAAGSIATIAALLSKIFSWEVSSATTIVTTCFLVILVVGLAADRIVNKINHGIEVKLEELEKIVKEEHIRAIKSDEDQAKAICRLELAMMMSTQPSNKVAIGKKARYYFRELGGNDWMGQAYSDWEKKYDGGISALLHDKAFANDEHKMV